MSELSCPRKSHQMSDELAWRSRHDEGVIATYQLSFCVSGAIARSTFSFSARNVSLPFRCIRCWSCGLPMLITHRGH
jgi:hypothetical protein